MNLVPIDGNRWSSRPPNRDYRLIIDWPMPMPIDAYVTVHKIFWEAGNRRLKSARCKARWHLRSSPVRIAINVLKLPYEANSKHLSKATMRSWKFSKSFSSVMFFRKGSSVLILGFDSSLSRDANSTVSHYWNEAQQQFYQGTFVGRDAHRLMGYYSIVVWDLAAFSRAWTEIRHRVT